MKKKYSVIIIIFFAAMLVIPLFFMDFWGGEVSQTEKRQFAKFPFTVDETTGEFNVSRTEVEEWLNDNIGFRSSFIKLYSTIKFKYMGLSTSESVLIGRNGWYYYTGNNNIEIATGDYPLTEQDLELIAEYQQQISDYYHSIGKQYILMLTPSKVSIYPEYLPMYDEVTSITPVDIVEEYLNAHTDVLVYNPKDMLLENKDKGQLYRKIDSHWNTLGSYYVYCGLLDVMKQKKIIDGEPIDVNFSNTDQGGEFSALLGDNKLLPLESVPIAEWDESFDIITRGDKYQEALEIQTLIRPPYVSDILINSSVPDLKLEIYGDSQISILRKIPYYLAEHFSQVYNFNIRKISIDVDTIEDPDVILFSCSERFISSILTVPADIPSIVEFLPDIELIRSQGSRVNQGMYIDFCDSIQPDDNFSIMINKSSDIIEIKGWAADFSVNQPLSELYLQIGDVIIKCDYGIERSSVKEHYNNENLLKTGFRVRFPNAYLNNGKINEIKFIQITADGNAQYEPVVYEIKYKE